MVPERGTPSLHECWDLGQLHTKKREEVFLLKSEMGLLRRRRNWTNLKLCQSFGSNSNGKERGLALCGLVPGCCDNGLKERQLRRGERERKRERERDNFF